MMWPPSLARVRVVEKGRKKVGLCLPLILIWPPLLILGIALAPLVVICAPLICSRGNRRAVVLVGPRLFRIFCALRGLRVEVDDGEDEVLIYFI